jgi:hypothetical protein
MGIAMRIPSVELKAVQAIHDHSQTFAREQLLTGLQLSKVEKDHVNAQYTFSLAAARSSIHGQDAIAITKKHYNKQTRARRSLLGLPRGKLSCHPLFF